MASICLFASYVVETGMPYHTKIFLFELKKYCSKVIYLHSNELDEDANSFIKENDFESLLVVNEGFDFGQWQKALLKVNLYSYDQLYLINDSSILFAPLDGVMKWFNNSNINFGGLTESISKKRHIQSYFLLFKKSTFNSLKEFFSVNKSSGSIYQVIDEFEIGLSQYLLSQNFSCEAYLHNDGYDGEFAPYYQCIESHIKQGSPMIKKKIIFSSYRNEELFTLARMNFNIDVNFYCNLIKKYNQHLLISFDVLLNSESNKLNLYSRIKYYLTSNLIQLYRKFKKNK